MIVSIDQADIASLHLVEKVFLNIFPNKPSPVSFLKHSHYKAWMAFIAENKEDKTPVGFVIVQHVLDEVEIIDMGILADYRRRGIAKAMLYQIVSNFYNLEVKNIFLEVDETNHPAIQLYKHLGFREIARRRRYYYINSQTSHDALNMRLNLSNKAT